MSSKSPIKVDNSPGSTLYNLQISSLEEQMLDASELFQYSLSFRNLLFLVSLQEKSLEKLLTDFQVLYSSQILLLAVLPHSRSIRRKTLLYKKNGVPVEYYSLSIKNNPNLNLINDIKEKLSSFHAVIIGIEDDKSANHDHLNKSLELANIFNARKFFYVQKNGSLEINNKPLSHISINKLESSIQKEETTTNIDKNILEILVKNSINSKHETIILDDSPGALFQELFTHQGRGTLITEDYPNEIRTGKPRDIFMISRIMKPYIEAGILLPINEKELSTQIKNFLLYTINGSIVAGARMVDYDDAAELSKFFCLPRFRRQGHARSLCKAFIDNARKMGKKYVFSLSISQGMWDFLRSLGFSEIDRDELPEKWRNKYNFNRESKAFKLEL